MTTLRRELIKKIEDTLIFQAVFCSDGLELESPYKEMYAQLAEQIADAVLELRFLGVDQGKESPAFHDRQEDLRDDLAENSLEAAVILGKPLGKSAQKIKDSLEFHTMICAELARLPFNFDGDLPKEQENFKKFLKEKQKMGQELSTWVNWWMSDEWRVANPPWKLTTIKIKWLEAFPPEPKIRTESSGHYA